MLGAALTQAQTNSTALKAGAQLIAISMDQPGKLKETPGRDKLGYRLLSDSGAVAVKAFGIAFTLDDRMAKNEWHP